MQKIDWGLKIIDINNVWQQTRGCGIKIAVLDTGGTRFLRFQLFCVELEKNRGA